LYKLTLMTLCLFVLSLVMRLPEFLADIFGFPVRFILVLSVFCAFSVLVSGALTRVFPSRIALLFTVLAGWIVLAIPFSIWRGGSFAVLIGFWVLSVATFYFAAGTPLTLEDCSKLMASMGIAVILLLAAAALYIQVTEGRVGFDLPSLANPNLFAMQIIYGLPFCPLIFRRFPRLLASLLTFAILLYAGLTLIRTGSRSALLSMIVMSILLILTASVRRKVFLLTFTLVGVLFIVSSGSVALERYSSLFSGKATSIDAVSAQQSSDLRWKLFLQSLEISLSNPLFGVGPGNFSVATADLKRDDRTVAAWLGSHNTPTQFSSEAGIPAGLLFLALVGSCVYVNGSIYLKHRRDSSPLASDLAYALLLSLIGLSVTALFASVAYQFYFPLLFGLTVALQRIVQQQQRSILPAKAPPSQMTNAFSRPPVLTALAPSPPPVHDHIRRPPRNWASRTGSQKPIQRS
jgi:O-antigen ligase